MELFSHQGFIYSGLKGIFHFKIQCEFNVDDKGWMAGMKPSLLVPEKMQLVRPQPQLLFSV